MQSFDFQVVVDCPLEIVFGVYADIERWRHRNLFGDIKWVQGNPWEEGSRLRIETLTPIRTTVDQVVQHFLSEGKCQLSQPRSRNHNRDAYSLL